MTADERDEDAETAWPQEASGTRRSLPRAARPTEDDPAPERARGPEVETAKGITRPLPAARELPTRIWRRWIRDELRRAIDGDED